MEVHGPRILEYNYITDGIYIGTNLCCITHFDLTLKDREGIFADMSLEFEKIDVPFGVDFYVWIPVKDHEAPAQDKLIFGVSVLRKWVKMKRKIYLHCRNGHGRAPTMCAAYLMDEKHISPSEAEEFIKRKRPTMHLENVQRESLARFASSLNASSKGGFASGIKS